MGGGVSESSPSLPPEEPARASRSGWIYLLAGVGVAGAAAGTVAGVMTLQKKDEAEANCDDALKVCNQVGKDANDSGRALGTISTVGIAVGAVGLGGAFYLWLSEPGDPTSARLKAKVRPDVAFVSLEQRF